MAQPFCRFATFPLVGGIISTVRMCPVLLPRKSKREGSCGAIFAQSRVSKLLADFGRKCATQGSPVVVSQSNFAKVFACFLGRLPLLIARFICHWQHSQTSPNQNATHFEWSRIIRKDNQQNKKDTRVSVLFALLVNCSIKVSNYYIKLYFIFY